MQSVSLSSLVCFLVNGMMIEDSAWSSLKIRGKKVLTGAACSLINDESNSRLIYS